MEFVTTTRGGCSLIYDYYHYRWMTTPTSLVDEGTIREERRMPEDDLTGGKMMNVTDSRQTRKTLVYSHCQSPQISQTTACCYQNIGKSSAIPSIGRWKRAPMDWVK